jgi:acyl-coenzyme A thioesterase PaaI-like protein
MSIGFDRRDDLPDEGEDITTQFVLRKGFEGAPGRAHGGMVAAAFDDITGWVIAQIRQPAFTGELTVRFEAPVPVDTEFVVTTRLAGRDGRKLYITAEMTAHGQLVATCKATYITVDPSIFAGAPDPR